MVFLSIPKGIPCKVFLFGGLFREKGIPRHLGGLLLFVKYAFFRRKYLSKYNESSSLLLFYTEKKQAR